MDVTRVGVVSQPESEAAVCETVYVRQRVINVGVCVRMYECVYVTAEY